MQICAWEVQGCVFLLWFPEILRTFATRKVEKVGDGGKTVVVELLIPVLDEA